MRISFDFDGTLEDEFGGFPKNRFKELTIQYSINKNLPKELLDELDYFISFTKLKFDAELKIDRVLLTKGKIWKTLSGETIKITKERNLDGVVCYKHGSISCKMNYSDLIKSLYGEKMSIGEDVSKLYSPEFKDECNELVKNF